MQGNNKKQESGDGSNNFQVNGNVTVNGVSYEAARQIALDVFKANFYDFTEKAAQKAMERAEEMTEKLVKKFFDEIPHLANKLEEPSVQSSMFNAQKEYAKTGDKKLEERLLKLLIDRINSEERSLKQIVLDEALVVLPKLTNEQVDISVNLEVIGTIARFLLHIISQHENPLLFGYYQSQSQTSASFLYHFFYSYH